MPKTQPGQPVGNGKRPRFEVALDRGKQGEPDRFRVTGLSKEELAQLAKAEPSEEDWKKIFAVYVAGEQSDPRVSLLGEYRLDDGSVVFESRFPLQPGLSYKAVFYPARLPGAIDPAAAWLDWTFSLPAPPPTPPTVVERVFPSGDLLPENLLKFYLHFSAPMRRGEVYQRVHLLAADGQEVELPFLELPEELWDPSGMRLTLFFDPGRIKRGLKPREEFGPATEEGKSYTLLIDGEWLDAAGQPLKQAHRKQFKVVAPDDKQPSPEGWKLIAPRAGTTDPLTVQFDEPLDEAMLNGVLAVVGGDNAAVDGRIEIDQRETRWRFHPKHAWQAGRHSLLVDTTLEDLAGNSIGRPFEVDQFGKIKRKIVQKTVSLPFEVAPNRNPKRKRGR